MFLKKWKIHWFFICLTLKMIAHSLKKYFCMQTQNNNNQFHSNFPSKMDQLTQTQYESTLQYMHNNTMSKTSRGTMKWFIINSISMAVSHVEVQFVCLVESFNVVSMLNLRESNLLPKQQHIRIINHPKHLFPILPSCPHTIY